MLLLHFVEPGGAQKEGYIPHEAHEIEPAAPKERPNCEFYRWDDEPTTDASGRGWHR